MNQHSAGNGKSINDPTANNPNNMQPTEKDKIKDKLGSLFYLLAAIYYLIQLGSKMYESLFSDDHSNLAGLFVVTFLNCIMLFILVVILLSKRK